MTGRDAHSHRPEAELSQDPGRGDVDLTQDRQDGHGRRTARHRQSAYTADSAVVAIKACGMQC